MRNDFGALLGKIEKDGTVRNDFGGMIGKGSGSNQAIALKFFFS